jgi:hypothetical protein
MVVILLSKHTPVMIDWVALSTMQCFGTVPHICMAKIKSEEIMSHAVKGEMIEDNLKKDWQSFMTTTHSISTIPIRSEQYAI